jgi:hypothetical protein
MGARPFMIMTSLLSSARRLPGRMPMSAIDRAGMPGAIAPESASNDSA